MWMSDPRSVCGGLCIINEDFGNSGQKKNAESDIKAAGQSVTDASKLTPQESSQYQGSFDIGSFLKQLFGGQVGMNAMPSGAQSGVDQFTNQNPLAKGLYDQTLQDVNNPYGSYESALHPALMQAQDTINSYYQKRGLLNSGLAIEGMGRAGVDLAIQEAQGKMQARQQAMSNASGLNQNIFSNQQQNYGNLANLYNSQQGYGQNAMSRQYQGAAQAAGYQAYPAQAALGNFYGQQGAVGQGVGTALGAGAGFALGGPMGAYLGGTLGGGVGKSFS